MGTHGIRNRPERHTRRMTDAITPDTPSAWGMVIAGLGALATVAIWAVVVTLILAS